MRNILMLDLDTERRESVVISKPESVPPPRSPEEWHDTLMADMGTLCEGLVALIHLADGEGFRPSAESLRMCIAHLTQGFADASASATSPLLPKDKAGQ